MAHRLIPLTHPLPCHFTIPLKEHGNEADFLGVFAEIGSSWVPYNTFQAVPILASNSRRYSYSKNDSLLHRYGESRTLPIGDTGSRRLPISLSRGVDDSPPHWYESATPCITYTESRLLNFLKENSLYRWYGESSTPRTSDTVSRWLPLSLSRRVAGKSTTPHIVESGSQFGQKLARDVMFNSIQFNRLFIYFFQ